ncbi:MAG: acetyl-CoA carboxylase biotin carboxyl carrier protein subunit [Cryomorphaceae bacterium]|nr:acetyl-CoA carboxylase biotin carboxyl carrier protein subunit [Cryomorphaceae bacterium]
MIETNINDTARIISGERNDLTINDKKVSLSQMPLGKNHFHYQIGNKSYDVRVVKNADKVMTLMVNGEILSIPYKTDLDLMLEKMGLKDLLAAGNKEFKAPMPGMVLKILAKPGDEVKKGTPLLVLEAMKMENNIKAEGDGVVKSIEAKEGQSVEKNQILIHFE